MAIGTMLWLRAMATAWDMVDYGKMRYNLLGNGGHWFPGLSAAKLDELDPAAINKAVANSPFKDRVIAMLKETRDLLGAAEVKRLSTSD
jgi:predicted aldo/keto reductase-like oxidoreductase